MINFEKGDINIVFSFLNMKLRDEFSTLDSFTNYYSIDKEMILKRMEENGYFYNSKTNQFKKI